MPKFNVGDKVEAKKDCCSKNILTGNPFYRKGAVGEVLKVDGINDSFAQTMYVRFILGDFERRNSWTGHEKEFKDEFGIELTPNAWWADPKHFKKL